MINSSKTQGNGGPPSSPKLEIQQAMWSMKRYGENLKEWSLEYKFEQMASAGFSGIFGSLPAPEEERLWRKLMEEYNFSFGLESFLSSPEDLRTLLNRAQGFEVLYVNAQVPDAFTVGQTAIGRIESLLEEAEKFNIPLYIETHRGRITQDLLRTCEYVDAVPQLQLTIDFSHYVLAGEMYSFDQADPYFNKLLERTSSIHGRITNAQQIQISVGSNAEHPMVDPFVRWWKTGISHWKERAKPGDVLPFVCEIGHHYSVTPNYLPGDSWDELDDRWQQSLVMKRLAERCWAEVNESEF